MEKLKKYTGFIAFVLVLLTMPLGHAVMIAMEHLLGHEWLYVSAFAMGLVGLIFLLIGMRSEREIPATLWGLFGALLFWTGWIEFSFVYFANRHNVQPLIVDGEIATKPEYLIMPSSVGFLIMILFFYLFRARTSCSFFVWMQKNILRIKNKETEALNRRVAMVTFMEMMVLLWLSYLVLLFSYDERIFGDYHPVTIFIAFGSLIWSVILFVRLLKINKLGYAIRYAIPTVIIFWTFVEVMGRWNILKEVWVEPFEHPLEMTIIIGSFLLLLVLSFFEWKRPTAPKEV